MAHYFSLVGLFFTLLLFLCSWAAYCAHAVLPGCHCVVCFDASYTRFRPLATCSLFKSICITIVIPVLPSLARKLQASKRVMHVGPTSRVISVLNVCMCVCCLYMCEPLLYKGVIYSRETICKYLPPSIKGWGEAYRRARAKALFYAYGIAKGNTILKWTFQSRNLPPHIPIVLCKVVACWSL